MSDPIGAARAALGDLSTAGLQQDGPKRYTIDIGKDAPAEGPGSFRDTITGFVNQVSDAQDQAGALRDALLRGEHVELHRVTAASAEARIALDLMVELRNKVLDAYRTLVNMQG
jgi:flagellar hook-basal body complex protein FliE